MKGCIIALFAILTMSAVVPCPNTGDSHNSRIMALNKLKNRTIQQGLIPEVVGISDILKPGNDSMRWNPDKFVSVTGYIILVKYGGAETCNCHTKDKSIWDVHIELAASPTDKGKNAMICEAGANSRVFNPTLTMDYIKPLIGKKVTITGYLFPDSEHWQNSVNINPKGTNLWRATEWEIHPIATITVL